MLSTSGTADGRYCHRHITAYRLDEKPGGLYQGYSKEDNVAHFLNSSLNKGQIKQVKQDIDDGKTKLLYIAPETLTKEENLDYFHNSNISLLQWMKHIVSLNGDTTSDLNIEGSER